MEMVRFTSALVIELCSLSWKRRKNEEKRRKCWIPPFSHCLKMLSLAAMLLIVIRSENTGFVERTWAYGLFNDSGRMAVCNLQIFSYINEIKPITVVFIDCMVFNTVFNSNSVILRWPVHLSMLSWSSIYPALDTIFFPSHWMLFHITIVETERGMDPVAITTINPWKEYWLSRGSNHQPPVLKSATLPTEPWKPVTNNNVLWRSPSKVQKQCRIEEYSGNQHGYPSSIIMFYLFIVKSHHQKLTTYFQFFSHPLTDFSFSFTFVSFNLFQNKPLFLHVCSIRLLKTLWEKEKLLIMSNFSFSHCVFYPFW